jgi:disulfide bond formation protein DsbB
MERRQLAPNARRRHIGGMMVPRLRLALILCAAVSAGALGFVLGSETWWGLVPCPLCLLERWPYRIVAPLALLGATLPRYWARQVLALCILILAGGAGIAFVHVGVEFGWWPSPLPECAAPRLAGLSIAERLARLPAKPSVDCAEGTFLIPWLPISMAGMNLILALALSGSLAIFWVRTKRSPP